MNICQHNRTLTCFSRSRTELQEVTCYPQPSVASVLQPQEDRAVRAKAEAVLWCNPQTLATPFSCNSFEDKRVKQPGAAPQEEGHLAN